MPKDPRRLFTPSQRRALYWVSNGRCEECGIELNPKSWHADHCYPHSKGGATDVVNGRALCPKCNLLKGGNSVYPYAQNHLNSWPENIRLREWQKRFLERWLLLCDPNAGGQKDFLMAVVPAAGKTTASLKAAHEALRRGWVGRIVVVVPSLNLVEQWIDDASEKGIGLLKVEDYGTGISMPKDSAGIVTTYQTVARNPQRFRAYTSREPVFVIGDEIHHCGDGDNLSWGVGMKEAFEHDNTIRLLSSGTPFRTDNNSIPFVVYTDQLITNENGTQEIQRVARADFEYEYGEALRDGVVRDIIFPTWDSKLSWRRAGQEYTHTFQDDLKPQQASDRMKAALEPSGAWLLEVITNAHERLMKIRSEEGHLNAGGLIVCKNKEHADSVAKLVREITKTNPVVIHSDVEGANGLVEQFRKSNIPWIVTVRMVSEGVDIKRLRVGIYATNFKTRLYFLQVIARTTRYDSNVPGLAGDGSPAGQPAWFYVPDDPDLQNYMAHLMTISVHHIAEGLDLDNDDALSYMGGQSTFLDGYEFVNGEDVQETGHFYEERKWTHEEMEWAKRMLNGIPALDIIPDAVKALVAERFLSRSQQDEPAREKPKKEQSFNDGQKEPTLQDERSMLKKACQIMTRRLTYMLIQTGNAPVKSTDIKFVIPMVTAKLNVRLDVRNIGDSDLESLRERRKILVSWMNDIVKDKWDSTNLR